MPPPPPPPPLALLTVLWAPVPLTTVVTVTGDRGGLKVVSAAGDLGWCFPAMPPAAAAAAAGDLGGLTVLVVGDFGGREETTDWLDPPSSDLRLPPMSVGTLAVLGVFVGDGGTAAVAAVAAAAAYDFPGGFPADFAALEDVGGESANRERTAAAAAAAALFVEEEEEDFFVPAEVEAVAAALIAATAARSAEEDRARTGGAIGTGVTVVTASVSTGVAAGDGPAEYNPFSSSTTGPSTIQMSHTRCRPFWPALVSSARSVANGWTDICRV